MPGYYDDPEVKRLFDETYPGQGESVWSEQNRANNPPDVTAPSPGEQWLKDYTGRTGGSSGVMPRTPPAPYRGLPESPTRSGMGGEQPYQGGQQLPPPSGGTPYNWNPDSKQWSTTPPSSRPGVTTPKPGVNAYGRTPAEQDAVDRAEAAQNRTAAENERRNRVAEKLDQDRFDLEAAKADALNAYNQSMLQFNDRRLAQEAFDASVMASWRNAQTMLTQQLQGARIVVEQRAAQQDRRRRRPFAPRPRVSVA